MVKGVLAQLVERLHGMQEVSGSTPLSSTIKQSSPCGSFFYAKNMSALRMVPYASLNVKYI